MQTVATQAPAIEQPKQTEQTEQVNRIIINEASVKCLSGANNDAALYAVYFGAKAGEAAHAEKFKAAAHILITLITNGGNKRALLDPDSHQAKSSLFYRAYHASTSKAAAIKGLRAAIDIAKANISAASNSEKKAVELMQKMEDAFMSHAPKAKEARPATDKVAAAIRALQKAKQDHVLTVDHVQDLLPLVAAYIDVSPITAIN